jgi:hypothetical protein
MKETSQNAVFDFSDSELLTGEHGGDVDLLTGAVEAGSA